MGKSRELVSFFEEMLSRQEYLIPMVAASFQYPIHYYGMTSAALLEDLFVDASINFRNNHRRDVEISRPERDIAGEEASSKGVRGWDYQFQGEHFSHKVGKGVNEIALLWDATVKLPEDKKWSYDSTMVYVLSHYKKASANLLLSGNKIQLTSVLSFRNKSISAGQQLLIVERLSRTQWKVHEVSVLSDSSSIVNAIPFDAIWGKMVSYWAKDTANKFELFITTKATKTRLELPADGLVEIDFEAHPGIYVFEREQLQNIEVTQNNRAVLLPRATVMKLIQLSAEEKLFVFMPSWYMAYAENRPADLYLAQKQEFDLLNSASRRRT
jgi:hypothetical protein